MGAYGERLEWNLNIQDKYVWFLFDQRRTSSLFVMNCLGYTVCSIHLYMRHFPYTSLLFVEILAVCTFFQLLGGLRVTNPTIRLVCPSVCLSVRLSVCPSVCPSVCLSVNISLVNTITQQILGALIRNLYHGCISGVSWLSSKMDDLDLFLRSRGSI